MILQSNQYNINRSLRDNLFMHDFENRKMIFKPTFIITKPMANDLTKVAVVKGFLDVAILSEDWTSEMQKPCQQLTFFS